MARTQHVKSARARLKGRAPFTCYSCRKPIEPGQEYYWNQPSRFHAQVSWHAGCPHPPASMLESNEKRARAYEAFEQATADLQALEVDGVPVDDLDCSITSILEACAEGINEAAEMWREAASNIEDGFGHSTFQSDEMNDHADVYEDVASSVEQITWDVPEGDDDDLPERLAQVIEDVQGELDGLQGDID